MLKRLRKDNTKLEKYLSFGYFFFILTIFLIFTFFDKLLLKKCSILKFTSKY